MFSGKNFKKNNRKEKSESNILFVAYQIPPIAGPAAQRHLRFLTRLGTFGYKPFVLTVRPDCVEEYYPLDESLVHRLPKDIKIYKTNSFNPMDKLLSTRKSYMSRTRSRFKGKNSNELPKELSRKDLQIKKIKDFISEIFRIPDRQIGWYLFALTKGIKIISKNKIDVIFSSANPWTCHLIGLTLSKLFKIPLIADFRDPWTQNPYKEHPFKIFERIDHYLEHKVVKNAAYTICNTIPLKNRMIEFYSEIDNEKFVHISNGFWEPLFKGLDFKKTDKRLIISHVGTLYARRTPITIFKAISKLKKKSVLNKDNFLLRFVGGRGVLDIDPGILNKLEIEDIVEIIPRVEHNKALNIIAKSDILLIIQPDTRLQIPGKIFEYIAVGHPILAISGEGATADLVNEEKIGFVVSPEDVEGLEQLLNSIMGNYKQGKVIKNIPKTSHNKYESYYLTEKLVNLFQKSFVKNMISNGNK